MIEEILGAIVSLFLGDLTSKVGWAVITMLFGVIVIIRPIVDLNGKELDKSYIPYLIGSGLIIISIYLFYSWLKKRKTTNKS